jgi:hypothetical protein
MGTLDLMKSLTLPLNGTTASIGLKMTTVPLFGKAKWRDTELEKDFQARVTHLAKLYHWQCYAVPDSRRASLAGFPDLTLWNVGQQRLIFAELKREKGRLSESQKVVLSELQQLSKCEVYIWRPSDFDDIIDILKGNK